MKNQTASGLLLIILACIGVFGLAFFLWILPEALRMVLDMILYDSYGTRYTAFYYAWMGFFWATAVPCYCALLFAVRVARRMGSGEAFSRATARDINRFALCALVDACFVLAVNVAFLFFDLSHPGVFLFFILVELFGAAVYILFRILAAYVLQAAVLREEQELTV